MERLTMLQTMVLAVTAIVAASIAQALIKYGLGRTGDFSPQANQLIESVKSLLFDPYIVTGFLLILVIVPIWLIVLARLPFSVASPMVSLGYIVALGIGVVVFKEALTPLKLGGVGLILVGVIFVARSQ